MITLLAGGVGAARLLRGLARVVRPRDLTVVVNTGDDDEFYGLHVSPDIDTILYTLAGLAPLERGWGIDGDTFTVRDELDRVAGRGWFALGDRDLATHIQRTRRLGEGATHSEVTREMARARGVKARVLPMSDDAVRTVISTDRGELAFQDYLVRLRARPLVRAVRYRGARTARPAPGVLEAIAASRLVILAPSNPFVSIGPILAVPGIRRALVEARERVVAVSPLIGGRAVKGPLASMLGSMGLGADTRAIANLYRGFASTLVVAPGDAPDEATLEASGNALKGTPRPASKTAGRRVLRPPLGIEFLEHDILLLAPKRAEKLARFLVGRRRRVRSAPEARSPQRKSKKRRTQG